MSEQQVLREKMAFAIYQDGYHFTATYLLEPKGEALIEIEKDDRMVKSFLFPAYKIWNIAAHASDIAADLDSRSNAALYEAGSDGLGGNAYGG